MTRVFVVRHGNTFEAGEPPRRIGRRTDLPLTDAGVAQAMALGAWFAAEGIRFDTAHSSPLRRTTATAAHILARQRAAPPLVVLPWLTEIDHGPDEDQPEGAVIERIGLDALVAWDRRGVLPAGWHADGEAVSTGWRHLVEGIAGTCLVVTSNGTARSIFDALGGVTAPPSRKLATGAYGEFDKAPGGYWQLRRWDERPPHPAA